jgi:hypothetical protein
MFTQEEAGFRIYPQTGFQVDDVGTPSAKVLPAGKDFQVKRTRNTLANEQVQADGFEREFALGNHISKATGSLICNFNFLGYLMKAIGKTFTSVSFTGVYSVTVSNAGSGHTASFLVTGTGGAGTGFEGLAVVLGGSVIYVAVTKPGSGYTSAPTLVWTAGTGTGTAGTASIDATKNLHTSAPGSGAPVLWTIEKFAGTYYRRFYNMVLTKMSLANTAEGICTIPTEWTGSGHVKKSTTPLDASPIEVTGTPGEYASLTIAEASTGVGVIDQFTASIETGVKEKRPPGYQGKASELRKGGTIVGLDGTAYFEDEVLANKMEAGTLTDIRAVTISPDGIFNQLYPESKMEVDDWERQDGGVMLPFKVHSIKKSSALAPASLTLINGTTGY